MVIEEYVKFATYNFLLNLAIDVIFRDLLTFKAHINGWSIKCDNQILVVSFWTDNYIFMVYISCSHYYVVHWYWCTQEHHKLEYIQYSNFTIFQDI